MRDTNRNYGTGVQQSTAKYSRSTAKQKQLGTRIRLGYEVTHAYLPIRRQTRHLTQGVPCHELQPARQIGTGARSNYRLELTSKKAGKSEPLAKDFLIF